MRKPDLGCSRRWSECSTSRRATWRSWVRRSSASPAGRDLPAASAPGFRIRKPGEPGILIAGHLDTVHPVGTMEKLQWRREGNKCYGPGIFDMKGGNYLTLEAIRQLARASFTTPLPITVLFTPDEEVGTPSIRDIIEAEAARNKYVLVPEPGRPRTTASSPGAMQSRASISKPSASRAMPAPRCPRAVRRSARWRGRSSRSTA